MDCSEGSFGQLYDHFNDIQTIQNLLANLKCIFITHMHGDHHLGTLKMLSERDKALCELFSPEEIEKQKSKFKIYVIIPYFMEKWIRLGIEHMKHKDLVEIIHLHELNPEPKMHYEAYVRPGKD